MDPNSNQQQPISPITPTPAPVPPAAVQPAVSMPMQPIQAAAPVPKKGHGKGIVLLLLIILLIIGGGVYLLFANSQTNNTPKIPAESTENTMQEIPTPTAVPTPIPENDLNIEDPEADLNDIDADLEVL